MSLKVLLADKSSTMRKIILLSLRAIGPFDTVEVSDGEAALAALDESEFDLVLVEWNLSGKSGLEVLYTIRQRGLQVPVVMMATTADRRRVMTAIDAGVTEYLVKPFTPQTRIKLAGLVRSIRYQSLCLDERPDLCVAQMNPFLTMTMSVFETMLGCRLTRGEPYLQPDLHPRYEVSAVIDISGEASGTVVLSFGREAALAAAARFLPQPPAEMGPAVGDVIGELANIIAGNAQPQFEEAGLGINPPRVVLGTAECVEFPPGVTPVCIPFESEWGPVAVQVGLSPRDIPVTASA